MNSADCGLQRFTPMPQRQILIDVGSTTPQNRPPGFCSLVRVGRRRVVLRPSATFRRCAKLCPLDSSTMEARVSRRHGFVIFSWVARNRVRSHRHNRPRHPAPRSVIQRSLRSNRTIDPVNQSTRAWCTVSARVLLRPVHERCGVEASRRQ